MIASRKGHLKVVKRLLEHGAVLDHQNVVRCTISGIMQCHSHTELYFLTTTELIFLQNGLSSLSISIYEKRTAVALFLIHKGASIHLAEKVIPYDQLDLE